MPFTFSEALLMKPLPKSVRESQKSCKYVLFRIPKDLPLADLDGAKIDLQDLKILSGPKIAAVTDLHLNKERASACPLLPEETESGQKPSKMRCGPTFEGIVQIIRKSQTIAEAGVVTKSSEKKSRKKKRSQEE